VINVISHIKTLMGRRVIRVLCLPGTDGLPPIMSQRNLSTLTTEGLYTYTHILYILYSNSHFTRSSKNNQLSKDANGEAHTLTLNTHSHSDISFYYWNLTLTSARRIEDWEWLESQNISVRGKIVIVRYGEIFRGDKCHMAEQRGAVGCLIYSDPADDGNLNNN
jgi:hypothetical protein